MALLNKYPVPSLGVGYSQFGRTDLLKRLERESGVSGGEKGGLPTLRGGG